jgi:WhiB family redox-sensing transcriptional regulator
MPDEVIQYDLEWREEALCKDTETNDYFPYNINKRNLTRIRDLVRTCYSCPVNAQCLLEAVVFEYDGIWGGTLPKQRSAWIKYLEKEKIELTLSVCSEFLNEHSDKKNVTETGEKNV